MVKEPLKMIVFCITLVGREFHTSSFLHLFYETRDLVAPLSLMNCFLVIAW